MECATMQIALACLDVTIAYSRSRTPPEMVMMTNEELLLSENAYMAEVFDRVAVADMIQRERAARDSAAWEEMATYYHPESIIEVAWFKGSGAEFVRATQKNWRSAGNINFHELGAAVVTLGRDRAVAEMACTLHGFHTRNGVDVKSTGYIRLLWRAQKVNGRWLIAGLRALYIRDLLQPCNPNLQVVLDEAEVAAYRPSYRFLTATLKYLGRKPKSDLPGVDQPGTAEALRKAEHMWLRES